MNNVTPVETMLQGVVDNLTIQLTAKGMALSSIDFETGGDVRVIAKLADKTCQCCGRVDEVYRTETAPNLEKAIRHLLAPAPEA